MRLFVLCSQTFLPMMFISSSEVGTYLIGDERNLNCTPGAACSVVIFRLDTRQLYLKENFNLNAYLTGLLPPNTSATNVALYKVRSADSRRFHTYLGSSLYHHSKIRLTSKTQYLLILNHSRRKQ